jgi:hypothetical protein
MSRVSKLVSTVGRLFVTAEPAVIEQKRRRQIQNILWQEWHHCQDETYREHLAQILTKHTVTGTVQPQERPLAIEVETALRQATQRWPQAQAVWIDALRSLDKQRQQPASPAELVANLQSTDWEERFVARHSLATLGGEAAIPLAVAASDQRSPVRQVALWLLRSIEAETRDRLSAHYSRLLCPRCLVRFYANAVFVPDLPEFVYYGCRTCGQSREFLEWLGDVVTVLDEGMAATYVEQDGVLRGNWLRYRSLFDCDWVEINQATDEDVERFAVQLGNDTDPLRRSRYREMRCLVGPECHLSENTLRILKNMFGQVAGQEEVVS